jgi:hypothetical protein
LHGQTISLKQGQHATRRSSENSLYLVINENLPEDADIVCKYAPGNTDESGEEPESKRVIGKSGSNIVFSCTWKENRKNDIDDVRSAYGSKGSVGVEMGALSLV